MDYQGKTILVTGAANGLGKQIADEAAARGMNLYLVDIDAESLARTVGEFKRYPVAVESLVADVSLFSENERMLRGVNDRFGGVDVLVLNAGVPVTAKIWELPVEDLDWIVQANLSSIAYGIKLFVPEMLRSDEEKHIVVTASAAGLFTVGMGPMYHATKFAAVALSESVSMQLADTKIRMHCLCPAFVQTDLHNYQKRRPERFKSGLQHEFYTSGLVDFYTKRGAHSITTGMPVDSIGMIVFEAMQDGTFYILTHPEVLVPCRRRAEMIINGETPMAKL